ncbi:DUF1376 domain-containing protein [Chromobacterium sp. CV08]|uniref:DUF1376 domain-containing protein n=1 Tax=Chromobacterium sp. CV08 TaxID=3133274 RepID=UPI003DA87F55
MNIRPLTPPDCDLRDFAFIPLDVVRLRDSDFAAVTSGEEFRAGLLLWCTSWHQVPAASLPDDDVVLARLAGYGRVVSEWQKVRGGALHGWLKCSDGRLYHPVVAEKANEAWRAKLTQRWKTECARIKKQNQRQRTNLQPPELDDFLDAHCPQGQALVVPRDNQGQKNGQPTENRVQASEIAGSTEDFQCPQGQTGDVPEDTGSLSPSICDLSHELPISSPVCPSGNGIQGTGIGTETGINKSSSSSNVSTHSRGQGTSNPLPPLPEPSGTVERIGLVCRLLRDKGVQCSPSQFAAGGKFAGLEQHSDDDFHLAVQTLQIRGETRIGIGLLAAVLGDMAGARNSKTGGQQSRAPRAKPWFLSSSGIESKAEELGYTPPADAPLGEWKYELFKLAGVTQQDYRAATADFA